MPPWSQVRGRLVKNRKPVPQENIDLEFDNAPWSPGQPHLNLHGAVADEQGRFSIEKVPAGQLRLTTRVPVGDRGWFGQKQKSFTLRPGENLDLGEIEKK